MRKMTVYGISTRKWTHADELPYPDRTLRKLVKNWNDQFGKDEEHQYYILSGVDGYKLSDDPVDITLAIDEDIRKARMALARLHKRRKRLMQIINGD